MDDAYFGALDPGVNSAIIVIMIESVALEEARRQLAWWLESGRMAETVARSSSISYRLNDKDSGADMVVQVGNHLVLAIEYKGHSDAAAVASAAKAALLEAEWLAQKVSGTSIPVVVVPFMGGVGKRICDEARVSWFDLSGNGHIVAPGLGILVEGRPNKFTRRGRPFSVFAPKSARIARLLLLDPQRSFRQQELAHESGLDRGFVSRIVRRMEADGLVRNVGDGRVGVVDPDLLLDAWSEVYDFAKHTVVKGHITAPTSEKLVADVSSAFTRSNVRFAATGLAAAWLYTSFAGFRLATFFVEGLPDPGFLDDIGFREEPKGANVWLAVPDDEGVFLGSEVRAETPCVHPVQAYLDLQAQPERAKEAASELRSRLLGWKSR